MRTFTVDTSETYSPSIDSTDGGLTSDSGPSLEERQRAGYHPDLPLRFSRALERLGYDVRGRMLGEIISQIGQRDY